MIYNTFELHQEGSLPGAHLVTYIQEDSDAPFPTRQATPGHSVRHFR